MMSTCFTWLPIASFGDPNIYQNLGDFTRMWDFTWRVSYCEELVGPSEDKKIWNDGHLYGHQGVIVKSQILYKPLVLVAHQTGLEPVTY